MNKEFDEADDEVYGNSLDLIEPFGVFSDCFQSPRSACDIRRHSPCRAELSTQEPAFFQQASRLPLAALDLCRLL